MRKLYLMTLALICGIQITFSQDSLPDLLKKMTWRNIGPANMGGRVTDIDGMPGDASTFYVSGADGGLFKTSNGGTTFTALFTDQRVYSVGALTVAPSDKNVLWLGSGEGDPRNSVSYGNGVYRSTDGGQSWSHLGLDSTERIKRIVVHPDDPDIACVCALGKEWGPNADRGVFKTIDGGKTWKKVLYLDEDTGCADLDIDFSNPRILYAGMWTFRRKPWRFDDGGKQTAIYRSKDGGDSWEKIMKGLPDLPMSRPGITVAQSKPSTIYLVAEFKDAGTFFRSDDRGDSWTKVNEDPNINFRPFYYSDIRVDPNDHRTIYSLSGQLFKSTDGGKEFKPIAEEVHGDFQSLWIDPENSNRLLCGSDGGYQVSLDQGLTWHIINNVELSQFYQLNIDDLEPYNVYGGLQDNGCWVGPSNSLYSAGILKRHWKRLSYGDGYYAVPIPGSEHEVYTNLQGGVPFHVDSRTGIVRSIHPFPKIIGSAGDAIENHKYRFNWDSPIYVSPHDPNTVYFGGNVLFKSTDRGDSWQEISPDLTTNDKEKQRSSGGEIYQDNTAAEFHCSALTIAESPVQAGVIWVGTDDGNVQVTLDGGTNWENVNANVPELPPYSWIAKIHASEHDAGTAFMAVDDHRSDDFRPYAYMTTDFGKSWVKITNGLPEDDYVKVIRQDPHDPNLLFLGMECGIYCSWDKGNNWTRINNNLPPVSVRDLRIHPRDHDLVIGTHGRGVWILDDIQPLRDIAKAKGQKLFTFPVRPAIRWHYYSQIEDQGSSNYAGKNPEYGAYLNIALSEESKEPIKIQIEDETGRMVRELVDSTGVVGVNRLVWDLRGDAGTALDHPPPPGWEGGPYRPLVSPGKFKVTVTALGETRETEVLIRPDPRLATGPDDYLAQQTALQKLVAQISEVNQLINESEKMLSQLKAVKERVKLDQSADQVTVLQSLDQAWKNIENLQNTLRRPPPDMGYRQKPELREEIRSLMFAIGGAPAKPTQSQEDRVISLQEETSDAIRRMEMIISQDIKSLNEKIKDLEPLLTRKVKP
jgi:photosystem II stability/assembly factor-like uncharacterized protein